MLHYRFWLMEHSVKIVGYNRQITTSTLMLSDFLNSSFIKKDARVKLDEIIKMYLKTDKRFATQFSGIKKGHRSDLFHSVTAI